MLQGSLGTKLAALGTLACLSHFCRKMPLYAEIALELMM